MFVNAIGKLTRRLERLERLVKLVEWSIQDLSSRYLAFVGSQYTLIKEAIYGDVVWTC